MKRRNFVKRAGALTALSMLGVPTFAKPDQPTGLGLYTVRKQMKKDAVGTLKQIAEIGYTHVESAGYKKGKFYKYEPREFRKVLDDSGLRMISSHISLGDLRGDAERFLEAGKIAGCDYMILGYLNAEDRTLETYREVIDRLNELVDLSKSYQMQVGYHNHEFEFEVVEGEVPFKLMLEGFETYVPFELDLYWVTKAFQDPVKLIEDNPYRFPLWHVKDMSNTGDFAPVGQGTIDFQAIFNVQKTAGLKYFFVEQDETEGSPFDSIRTSYNNVQALT